MDSKKLREVIEFAEPSNADLSVCPQSVQEYIYKIQAHFVEKDNEIAELKMEISKFKANVPRWKFLRKEIKK